MNEHATLVKLHRQGEKRITRREICLSASLSTTKHQTRAVAMTGRRSILWAMARIISDGLFRSVIPVVYLRTK